MITRRSALAGLLAAPTVLRHARAATVVRMGALKLIHSITPYFYERFLPAGTTLEIIFLVASAFFPDPGQHHLRRPFGGKSAVRGGGHAGGVETGISGAVLGCMWRPGARPAVPCLLATDGPT